VQTTGSLDTIEHVVFSCRRIARSTIISGPCAEFADFLIAARLQLQNGKSVFNQPNGTSTLLPYRSASST